MTTNSFIAAGVNMLDQLFPNEIVHDLEKIRGEIEKVKNQYTSLKKQLAEIQKKKIKLKKEISKTEAMVHQNRSIIFRIRMFAAKYFGMFLFTRRQLPKLLSEKRLPILNRELNSLLRKLYCELTPQLAKLSSTIRLIEIYELNNPSFKG